MDINLTLTKQEIAEIAEAAQMGISMSVGVSTYGIKKLLFSLIKRIPSDAGLTFSSEPIEGRNPDVYIYFDRVEE